MDGWIVVSIITLGLAIIIARHLGFVAALSGKRGPFLVRQTLFGRLPRYEYQILEDVKLPYRDAVVQINHVVISRYGVYLIENLHNAGRVDPDVSAAHWDCVRGGLKNRLVNPLHKNKVHQNLLCDTLQLSPDVFHRVVVATGKTDFSAAKPGGVVRLGGLAPFILIRNDLLLEHEEVYAIAERIDAHRIAPANRKFPLPVAWRARLDLAGERLAALRQALHIGVDRRDPIAGLVRTATGFLFAALALTLSLNAVGTWSEGDHAPMMAAVESGSNTESPFADDQVMQAVLTAPQVGPGESEAEVKARRRQMVQQELDRQLAWEASLNCSIDISSGACDCRDPLGDTAPLSARHCEYLVATSAQGE